MKMSHNLVLSSDELLELTGIVNLYVDSLLLNPSHKFPLDYVHDDEYAELHKVTALKLNSVLALC